MKKLLVGLLLVSGLATCSAAEAKKHSEKHKEKMVELLLNDGTKQKVTIDFCRKFGALRNILDDLGEEDDASIPVSVCSSFDFYNISFYTEVAEDQRYDFLRISKKVRLASLLKTANFLDLEDTEKNTPHKDLIQYILQIFSLKDLNTYCVAQSGETYFDVEIIRNIIKNMQLVNAYRFYRYRAAEPFRCVYRFVDIIFKNWRFNLGVLFNQFHEANEDEKEARENIAFFIEKGLYSCLSVTDLLTYFPSGETENRPFKDLYILDLRNCYLKSLEGLQDVPHKATIRNLNCQFNSIKKISATDFAGYEAVKSINFDDNKIEEIEPGSFANLPCLEQLSLRGSNVTSAQECAIRKSVPRNCKVYFESDAEVYAQKKLANLFN